MWGKSWGRKMNTSVFETEQSLCSIDIIELLNGRGEGFEPSTFG